MTKPNVLRLLLLSLAFALGTHVVGWWAVPVLGLAWGIVGRGTTRPALTAGISAALAWAGWLLGSWAFGPVPLLAAKLGALTGLGGVTWVAATILFPLSLAWSAATVASLLPARAGAAVGLAFLIFPPPVDGQSTRRESLIAGLPRAAAHAGPRTPVRATEACVVIRVYDGDTLTCRDGTRVRLIGMDTPELNQKPYGQMARAALLELAPLGSTVRLERDVTATDRYGRRLAYVWRDSLMANWVLARGGWAVQLTYPPDVQYTEEFGRAVREARREGLGLWAVEGFACEPRDRRAKRCE